MNKAIHNSLLSLGVAGIMVNLNSFHPNVVKENPFFVYIPYNTPHSPFQVPDTWWDKFKEKELKMSSLTHPESENIEETRAALAMCENIDWNVGRVMKKLEELKLDKNTIVLYFNDNGPNTWRWNGGMKGRKGSTDEGGIRSHLVIHLSKGKGNLVLQALNIPGSQAMDFRLLMLTRVK